MNDMGSWEDEVQIRRLDKARDDRNVFDCCESLCMEQVSPCFLRL